MLALARPARVTLEERTADAVWEELLELLLLTALPLVELLLEELARVALPEDELLEERVALEDDLLELELLRVELEELRVELEELRVELELLLERVALEELLEPELFLTS